MRKSYLNLGALAALAVSSNGALAAPTAAEATNETERSAQMPAVQTWYTRDSIMGSPGNTTVGSVWKIGYMSGPNCDQGVFTELLNEYPASALPGLGGKGDTTHPDVLKNLGLNTSISGMNIPQKRIVMHPGGSAVQACVVLRFTVPAGTPSGKKYRVTANFMGPYPIPGGNPAQPGSNGTNPAGGVMGMIRVKRCNGYIITCRFQLGVQVDTGNNGGGTTSGTTDQLRVLSPGHTIDFAIWNKGNYGFDSTLLEGKVERLN